MPVPLAEHSIPLPLVHSIIAAVLVTASSASAAQVVTLYGGARAGGEFINQSAGETALKLDSGAAGSLSFDWILSDGRQAQAFYSFQRSALPGSALGQASDVPVNISYLHLGGRVFFDGDPRRGGGYVVGGLGATFFSPGLAGLSDEVRPSGNIGVGWQWTLAPNVALRTELRGYLSVINASGEFFCSGGCVVSLRGTTLLQAEGLLGLSIGF